MNKLIILLIKALIIGILTVIVGSIIGYVMSNTKGTNDLPNECKSWNKNYVMEKSLFLTGFVTYLLCQMINDYII